MPLLGGVAIGGLGGAAVDYIRTEGIRRALKAMKYRKGEILGKATGTVAGGMLPGGILYTDKLESAGASLGKKLDRVKKSSQGDILIPGPPSEEELLRELPLVNAQYHKRYNPDSIQGILDGDLSSLLDNIVVSAGHPSSYEEIEEYTQEIRPVIRKHKEYFNVDRPDVLAKKHGIPFDSDYLESAQTPSYPSGHTAQAYYAAYKLSDKYPELSSQFLEVANMVANSRIDRGVHFLSDNEAGILLAKKLYARTKESSMARRAGAFATTAGLGFGGFLLGDKATEGNVWGRLAGGSLGFALGNYIGNNYIVPEDYNKLKKLLKAEAKGPKELKKAIKEIDREERSKEAASTREMLTNLYGNVPFSELIEEEMARSEFPEGYNQSDAISSYRAQQRNAEYLKKNPNHLKRLYDLNTTHKPWSQEDYDELEEIYWRDISERSKKAEFTPDFTPEQLKALGVYDQVYGDAPSEASMKEWPAHWINKQDPLGWLQWYERYSGGRRTEDDLRQIKRWRSFKARHAAQYLKNPTDRRAAALRNWGIDAEKLAAKGTATKRDPAKWSAAKSRAKAKMGGKWSARAAQLAVRYYKGSGGTYSGKKPTKKNNKLKKWTKEDWGYRPGSKAEKDSKKSPSSGTKGRYLPKKKWNSLSKSEQKATDAKKQKAMKAGKGSVSNTAKAKYDSKKDYT